MPEYAFGVPVENTFNVQQPTVADLIAWLSALPPDARVPTDVLFRYNYRDNELSVR